MRLHRALGSRLSMIFSENRFTLFRIMLQLRQDAPSVSRTKIRPIKGVKAHAQAARYARLSRACDRAVVDRPRHRRDCLAGPKLHDRQPAMGGIRRPALRCRTDPDLARQAMMRSVLMRHGRDVWREDALRAF